MCTDRRIKEVMKYSRIPLVVSCGEMASTRSMFCLWEGGGGGGRVRALSCISCDEIFKFDLTLR